MDDRSSHEVGLAVRRLTGSRSCHELPRHLDSVLSFLIWGNSPTCLLRGGGHRPALCKLGAGQWGGWQGS